MPGKDGVVVNSSKAENVVAAKSTYWLSQYDGIVSEGALLFILILNKLHFHKILMIS